MPLPGVPLGHGLAGTLGYAARWIGATLLIATGLYALIYAFRRHGSRRLERDRLLGSKIGERGEALGGIVLVSVGIVIASGLL